MGRRWKAPGCTRSQDLGVGVQPVCLHRDTRPHQLRPTLPAVRDGASASCSVNGNHTTHVTQSA